MINRELYMHKIRSFMDSPVIKVITGMRRCGKSTLLRMIKNELVQRGVPESDIYYASSALAGVKDYMTLYKEVSLAAKNAVGRLYILLDEIQEVESWERAVNSFRVDFDCDIYVTGSNAKLLSGKLATLLTGRYVEIRVYPLSFAEYLTFANANPSEQNFTIREHFRNYLRYGGLPGIHQMQWDDSVIRQYTRDIYNSMLYSDVLKCKAISDIALLDIITNYVMDNIGNTFSGKSLADYMKSQQRPLSTETIHNYIQALADAYLIYKVPRFDIKGKHILDAQEKYYVSDLGLRHAVRNYRDGDIGGMLENVVYLELIRRGWDVCIGRQGVAEVDFVASTYDDKAYVQVCYNLTAGNIEREFRPLEEISDHYPKMVLTMVSDLDVNRNGIRQQDIRDFLTGSIRRF